MLNDSQKTVFRSLADNKAMFECLKEYLEEKFEIRSVPTSYDNADLGAYIKARWAVNNELQDAFKEIASCKSVESKISSDNPAM